MRAHKSLHEAILDRRLDDKQCQDIVTKLLTDPGFLRKKADPNAPDEAGNPPLHYAAGEKNREGVIRLLLEFNASPHQVDEEGDTPLHIAAHYGYLANVELLSELTTNFKVTNRLGETPLRRVFSFLKGTNSPFLKDCNPSQQERERNTARINDQYFPIAEKLFHLDTKPSFSESEYESKAFEWFYNEAMARGRVATIRKLFADGVPLGPTDVGNSLTGSPNLPTTRLHQVARFGHVGLMEFFLSQGIAMDACNMQPHNLGRTPLFFAAQAGQVNVIKFLLLRGAWTGTYTVSLTDNRRDKRGNPYTPLREVKNILGRPGPWQAREERAKYVKIFRLLQGEYLALTLLSGLHPRAGRRSTLTQLARKSTIFDRQVLRIPFRLAGCQSREQPPTPPGAGPAPG